MNFTIYVQNHKYLVEPVDTGDALQYKISTDCNYLMTVTTDDSDNWTANKDVQVLDNDLVTQIGHAIQSFMRKDELRHDTVE